jgi:multicomponent Na+:H+ antiporter subunit E
LPITRSVRHSADAEVGSSRRAALVRGAGFLAFWLVLIGADRSHLAAGVVAAAAGAWTSLRLLPPAPQRVRLAALLALALRFLGKSVVAGWDVAWRALDPRLPVRPGFVAYPVRFPPGPARNLFTTLTSLLPGTVPAGDEGGALVYHCLDVEQPVAAELAAEEALLSRALGESHRDA